MTADHSQTSSTSISNGAASGSHSKLLSKDHTSLSADNGSSPSQADATSNVTKAEEAVTSQDAAASGSLP